MKSIHRVGLLLVLVVSACIPNRNTQTGTPDIPAGDLGCAETFEALADLRRGLEIPDHFLTDNPASTGDEFDPNRYFEVFTQLTMEPGLILDYVYHYDWMGGYPVLYAREEDQPPFATEAEYSSTANHSPFMAHVQTSDTQEGFFQLAVLAHTANQFYLYWHANYNDLEVVCNKQRVAEILASLDGEGFGQAMPLLDQLRARTLINVEPEVVMTNDTATVRMHLFSHWSGFIRWTITIQRLSPHAILDIEEQILVPYDCGIMF